MKVKGRTLPFEKGEATSSILVTSCWHIGQPAVSHAGIRKFVETVKEKRAPWLHLGDLIEAILGKDPRFDASEHKSTFVEQCEEATKYLSEISDLSWGLHVGNHEHKIDQKLGESTRAYLADASGVDYLTGAAFTYVNCPDGFFRLYSTHGSGSANYKAGEPQRIKTNKMVKLRNIFGKIHADMIVMGHMHQDIVSPPVYERKTTAVGKKVKQVPVLTRDGWIAVAPSMFETAPINGELTNYAELKQYPPTTLGWIEILVERDGNIPEVRSVYENGEVKEAFGPMVL